MLGVRITKKLIKKIYTINTSTQILFKKQNCTLLNIDTKFIQKTKKHYDVFMKYFRVQIFSAKINLPSKPGVGKLQLAGHTQNFASTYLIY